jgi:hypothetical protein
MGQLLLVPSCSVYAGCINIDIKALAIIVHNYIPSDLVRRNWQCWAVEDTLCWLVCQTPHAH